MSNQSKKASNQVMASVILKNAICSLDETISNCRSLIKDVIALPRGANTTKQLLCVGNQLNYIEAIAQTISIEVSPYINIARNTGYLHKRIKTLHSSSTSEVPSTMINNILPPPPSLSTPTPLSSLRTKPLTKKRSVLQNISNKNKRMSKRIKAKALPTRQQLTVMPTPLDGDGSFSVHAAMKAYHNYDGKGKFKLVQYWISNNHIPCKKT